VPNPAAQQAAVVPGDRNACQPSGLHLHLLLNVRLGLHLRGLFVSLCTQGLATQLFAAIPSAVSGQCTECGGTLCHPESPSGGPAVPAHPLLEPELRPVSANPAVLHLCPGLRHRHVQLGGNLAILHLVLGYPSALLKQLQAAVVEKVLQSPVPLAARPGAVAAARLFAGVPDVEHLLLDRSAGRRVLRHQRVYSGAAVESLRVHPV